MKDIAKWVRPNVLNMKPYSSARDEFHGVASVFLDANENPYNNPINRYPDPMQWDVKERIATLKNVRKEQIFLGNGSDEAIDLLLRVFCEPAHETILTIAPSYGMYEVAAAVNDVACRAVLLRDDFTLDAEKLIDAVEDTTKIVFLCSPNNPSGNTLCRSEVRRVIESFDGLVVVDEAYIDYADEQSFLSELDHYPNLVVLQTFSKAWGAAALRCGMAFASEDIIELLNKVKYPYNINQLTQDAVLKLLSNQDNMRLQLDSVLRERKRLVEHFQSAHYCLKIYPSDANFLLIRVADSDTLYERLVDAGIIVRNRNRVVLCEQCLRITIGTEEENNELLNVLDKIV